MGTVYRLTLRQLSGKWRLIIMAILAGMPIVLAAIMLRADDAPSVREFETVVFGAMLAGSIAPLIVLAIAGASFANELEDRTLANITLTPIPRWQIATGKLLGSITIAAPFIAVSAFATSWIAFLGDVRATVAVTVGAVVGVALYASAFTYLGLLTTQAIGIGLLYIVLWEGLFSGFVAGVRLLSIRFYAIGLMHGLDPRRFTGGDSLNLPAQSVVALVVFAGFLMLSVRRLRRMDIP